ncbi:MAG: CotH kinase family protein [Kineosporiaceae bacterium]
MTSNDFQDVFKGRAIVLTDLPDGRSRRIAEQVNEAVGRGDATLYTKAEYRALFAALGAEDGGDTLTLLNASGERTATGLAVQQFLDVSIRAADFFDEAMYVVEVTGWPADHLFPDDPFDAPPGARLRVWRTDPADARHIPGPGPSGVLFTSTTFSLMNSGNRTKHAPKRSWKVNFDVGDDEDRVAGMSRLNLKAMYNDPSQMREALAWHMFAVAGLASPRHTFAKFALNGGYRGVFSVVEDVDRRFLREHFGANDRGNLYKAYCGDLGCATLENRDPGLGAGAAYRSRNPDDATYRLKTNEDDSAANTYDDLAEFIRRINGAGLAHGADGGDTFRAGLEDVFDVRAFLRWASVNILLGSWDNYFATPANYYLYNSGKRGGDKDFMAKPYFTFIPWDYDNCLGIDYFGESWQYADVLDWPGATRPYWAKQGHRNAVSRIPLVTNLLANQDFVRYYLDHLEYLLDNHFNPQSVTALMGTPIPGDDGEGPGGLWQRVKQAAYLEADTPFGGPFTGRQFSNDEVYRSAFLQNELRRGETMVYGVYHYTLMRYDRARAQLASLRRNHPSGSSGAAFPAVPDPLPRGT